MTDFEIHLDLHGRTRPIGLARSNRVRGAETIMFEYDRARLEDPDRFSLEPALALSRGAFAPPAGLATFGSIGDSAPDTGADASCNARKGEWLSAITGPFARLPKDDYLLGVADETRLGALRFRWVGDEEFQGTNPCGRSSPHRARTPAADHRTYSAR